MARASGLVDARGEKLIDALLSVVPALVAVATDIPFFENAPQLKPNSFEWSTESSLHAPGNSGALNAVQAYREMHPLRREIEILSDLGKVEQGYSEQLAFLETLLLSRKNHRSRSSTTTLEYQGDEDSDRRLTPVDLALLRIRKYREIFIENWRILADSYGSTKFEPDFETSVSIEDLEEDLDFYKRERLRLRSEPNLSRIEKNRLSAIQELLDSLLVYQTSVVTLPYWRKWVSKLSRKTSVFGDYYESTGNTEGVEVLVQFLDHTDELQELSREWQERTRAYDFSEVDLSPSSKKLESRSDLEDDLVELLNRRCWWIRPGQIHELNPSMIQMGDFFEGSYSPARGGHVRERTPESYRIALHYFYEFSTRATDSVLAFELDAESLERKLRAVSSLELGAVIDDLRTRQGRHSDHFRLWFDEYADRLQSEQMVVRAQVSATPGFEQYRADLAHKGTDSSARSRVAKVETIQNGFLGSVDSAASLQPSLDESQEFQRRYEGLAQELLLDERTLRYAALLGRALDPDTIATFDLDNDGEIRILDLDLLEDLLDFL